MSQESTSQYRKMTETPIAPLIVRLSIPTTLSMLMTSFYSMADTAFVGTIGTSASGAIGVVFGYMAIIQAFGFMLGQGTGSIVSRRLGGRDQKEANVVASTGFFLALAMGLVIAILSFVFLDQLLRILGSTPTIAPYAKTYIGFILIAAPFMTASFTLNQVLRFEGKATLGMVGMMTGCGLNVLGDIVLIFHFDMGIAGAGLSTCISEIVGFSVLLWMFLTGKSTTRLSPSSFSPDPTRITDIITTGFPALLRQGLASITTMLLNNHSAVYGDAAIAAMSIVGRVTFFVFSLALGVGQGFQPVCGFNYGARKYGRVREAYKVTMIICELLMAASVSILLLKSGDVIRIFRDDPEVIQIGTRALVLQGLSLLFVPISMVTEMLYQSTGERFGATFISAMRGGVLFIPAIIILSRLRGLHGIQEAQPFSAVAVVLPAIILARSFFAKLPKEDEPKAGLSRQI